MMHTTQGLYDQLAGALADVNRQLADIREDAEKQIAVLPYPDEVSPSMLKHTDGTFILERMLAAKAQILSGMAALKAAELASKAPAAPRRGGKNW